MVLRRLFKRRQAVRDSIDNLPLALCFFAPDGLVLLKNRAADRLSQTMARTRLVNGQLFTQALAGAGGPLEGDPLDVSLVLGPDAASGESPGLSGWPRSWRLPDGHVWTFSLTRIDFDGKEAFELSAVDTTGLFEANERLAEDTRRLSGMNTRLRRYARDVVDLARSTEILDAKVRIHDKLGQALLLTRRDLLGQQEVNEEDLLDTWEFCIGVLRREKPLSTRSANFDQIVAAGSAVGVGVAIEGDLPGARAETLRIVDLAASECLINAVRHAGARTMRISLRAEGEWATASFASDGRLSRGPVHEGGGLSGLRASVEKAGGSMEVACTDVFTVGIRLPLESEEL